MGNKVKMETSVCLGLAKAAPWALGFLAPNTFLCVLFLLPFHSFPSHSHNCIVGSMYFSLSSAYSCTLTS